MARKRELTIMASRLMASLLIRLLYSCLCECPSTRSERTILDAERWTLGIHVATFGNSLFSRRESTGDFQCQRSAFSDQERTKTRWFDMV